MHIFYLIPGVSYSGAIKYVVQLCRCLSSQNICTSIICEKLELFSDIDIKLNVYEVDFSNLVVACKKICGIISQTKDVILHNNTLDSMILSAMVSLITKCKFVSTVHVLLDENEIKNNLKLSPDLENIIFNANTIAVSHTAKERFIKCGFNPLNISVIYNGVENISTKIDSKKISSKIKIGFLGRLVKVKSIHTLIEAFEFLSTEPYYNQLELVIVGEGPQKEKLHLLAQEKKINAIFTGYTSFPYNHLNNFDILVIPSLREACPYVIMEAFNLRVPVIGSSAESIKEMIKDAKNGLIFKVGDPYDLSQKIKYALNNSLVIKKCIKNAYYDWETKYNFESFGQLHIEYYNHIMEEKNNFKI